MFSAKRRKQPKYKRAFGLLVIIFALLLIFTSSSPLISKPFVESQLAAISRYVAAYAKQRDGSDATLTYESVDYTGWGNMRAAVVHKPTITIKQAGQAVPQTIVFTTDSLQISASASMSPKLIISFPAPLTTAINGIPQNIVQFDSAPQLTIERLAIDNKVQIEYLAKLPPHFNVKMLGGPEQDAAQSYVVSYSADPLIKLRVKPEEQVTESEISIQDLQVAHEIDQSAFRAATLHAQFSRTTKSDGSEDFGSDVTLNDISLKRTSGETGPFSLKSTISGVERKPPAAVPDIDYQVKEFTLSHDKFSLKASGSASVKPDDSLPFGAINVSIDNLAGLREESIFTSGDRAFVMDLLQKISGQDVASVSNIAFEINRPKLGITRIGTIGVEDIAAMYIAHMIQAVPAQAAPAAAAPQPTPGDSVPQD